MPGAIKVGGKNPEALLKLLSPYFKTAYCGDLSKNRTYNINRPEALKLLFEVAHENASEEKLQIASLIESLHFCTKRAPVASILFDAKAKTLISEEELDKSNLWLLSVKVSGLREVQLNGKLTLPVKEEWLRFYKALPKNASENDIQDAAKSFWKRPEQSQKLKHVPTHRDSSLPILDSPSGAFRIIRKSWSKENVVQVHAVNAKLAGFAKVDGQTQWKKEVFFERFQSKKMAAFNARYFPETEVTSLHEWRQVLDGAMKVWLEPGSADRFNVRIDAPFKDVLKWISEGNPDLKLTSFLEMPSVLKIAKSKDFFNAMPEKLKAILNQPRSYIFFENIGERVRFRFTVESTTSSLRDAYNKVSPL